MTDASDFELQHEPSAFAPAPPPKSRAPWVVIPVAIAVALVLGWYLFGRNEQASPDATEFSDAAVPAPDQPLGGDPGQTVELPPLADTDALVRRLVGELSSHPRVAAWLATDGLIRNFTVAVQNVADGQVPAQALRVLRPSGRFAVIETDSDLRIDPRSYTRYDSLADAVNSVDAAGAAQLYTLLKPRIEEAYAELGNDVPFDRTLERAIVMLLRAPVLEGEVRLDPNGGVFAFENRNVERLTAAQKQLTRMGPRNARLIRQKLRAIGLALGIPAARLP